jgi:MATE family multidrug resistance protein
MATTQDDDQKVGLWLFRFWRNDSPRREHVEPPNDTTSLLPKPAGEETEDDSSIYDADTRTPTQIIVSEFWLLLKSSVPVILAYTLQNSLQTVSVLIVGRLSPEALSVAAFSYMFAMASAWLIGMGGTTAIDTLASASFTGSKNKHDLGIILQRAFIVLGLFYIPVAVLWLFSEPVFKALGQEDYIARDSSKFLCVLIPGGLGYVFFECQKKFLQAYASVVLC